MTDQHDDDLRALDGDEPRREPTPEERLRGLCRCGMVAMQGSHLCVVCASNAQVAGERPRVADTPTTPTPAIERPEVETDPNRARLNERLYDLVKQVAEHMTGEDTMLVGFTCVCNVVTPTGEGLMVVAGSPEGSPPPPRWKRIGMLEEASLMEKAGPGGGR